MIKARCHGRLMRTQDTSPMLKSCCVEEEECVGLMGSKRVGCKAARALTSGTPACLSSSAETSPQPKQRPGNSEKVPIRFQGLPTLLFLPVAAAPPPTFQHPQEAETNTALVSPETPTERQPQLRLLRPCGRGCLACWEPKVCRCAGGMRREWMV